VRKLLALSLSWVCVTAPLAAQEPTVERPVGRVVTRPYRAPTVPPIPAPNSDRLHALMRGGRLYLTLQDAIALAIENNLDLEVSRFGPLSAEWDLQRAHGGGPLRGVTSGNSFVNQVTGGQGVAGAELSAGVSGGNGGGGGAGGGNAVISQIGPVTPNLDPVFQNSSAWSHKTTPQANSTISQTTALVDVYHSFGSFVQQGLITGGYVQVAANESYLKENSPGDLLVPDVAPIVQIYARQNLLYGFGKSVNSRFIRVAQKQVEASSIAFRAAVLNLVASVVNQYWDLVAGNDDLAVRRQARDSAQKFYEDTGNMISVGTLAGVEIYRAQAELSARTQELSVAEQQVRQQELALKNALSRNGLEDPMLDEAEIVPLDRIRIPDSDQLPPLRDLVAKALAQRPDIALAAIEDQVSAISSAGTANGLLPQLQGVLSTSNRGNAGQPNPAAGESPSPNLVGGLGTALGQIFRHDYTSGTAGVSFSAQIGNRVAQGDFGIDQLQLRQGDLIDRKSRNQLVVDISNFTIAMRQARSRYTVAVSSRELQQELLETEQQKFSLGTSSINAIIAADRALAAARVSEVSARASYSRARVALDQVLGQTLEANNVSMDEAMKGRVSRESAILPGADAVK
jgi:outer membrane protein TolC